MDLAELIFRDARILASAGTSRTAVERSAELTAQGEIHPVICHRFPLDEVMKAYRLLVSRQHFGRIILIPPEG